MTQIHIAQGDCVETLRGLPDACIDSVVTDPPYGLSMEPNAAEVLRHWLDGDDYEHRGGGFMGKTWDSFVPGPSVWREVYRVLKPGGHMLVFSGTRTYDLTVLAIRIAGFQIRDQLAWMYGTGFPKSQNVANAIGRHLGVEPEERPHPTKKCPGGQWCNHGTRDERAQSGATKHPPLHVWPDGSPPKAWQGYGTALKPAQEPICLARRPLAGTVARNVLEHGTGGLNIDGCRVPSADGRWPANVLLDEAAAEVLGEPARFFYCAKASKTERERGLGGFPAKDPTEVTGRKPGSAGQNNPRAGMTGSNGRKNTHPTVKPIALMRYLVRLITPPGGVVLDPFNGSGSTGCAAKLEGVGKYIGCELSEEYCQISRARIEACARQEMTTNPEASKDNER